MKTKILFLIPTVFIFLSSCNKEDSITSSNNDNIDEMVFVEGGSFWMGDSSLIAHLETPVHKVNLSNFYMSKNEVTQKKWNEIMNFNPSIQKGDNLPVSKLLWIDAIRYCNERSRKEGLTLCYSIVDSNNVTINLHCNGYRLPTEAEWEYAAREGKQSQGYKYSGSDSLDEVGWYRSNSNLLIQEVGSKKANKLGLFDMSGNVYEWCWDRFTLYNSLEVTNPLGSSNENSTMRIIRGGSYYYFPDQALVTFRSVSNFEDNFYDCGFRVVRSFK